MRIHVDSLPPLFDTVNANNAHKGRPQLISAVAKCHAIAVSFVWHPAASDPLTYRGNRYGVAVGVDRAYLNDQYRRGYVVIRTVRAAHGGGKSKNPHQISKSAAMQAEIQLSCGLLKVNGSYPPVKQISKLLRSNDIEEPSSSPRLDEVLVAGAAPQLTAAGVLVDEE
jgi:hypothetical protein